jgi:N-methylhydantoinase A
MPKLKQYLERLESDLRRSGFGRDFFVILSSGGIMNSEYAGNYSVYSLLSGPAGGVVACSQLIGDLCGERDLITIDMGGTSYDVSLIRDGKPSVTTDHWVSRYRVAVPMLDIHTIGAGGGSIAWVDPGGALQVGPRSAGADPGPACYGKGGSQPTVTDAHLVLGFLDPDNFLGGEMRIDPDAARRAIQQAVAEPLGLDIVAAADGIFRIVNNNMCNGIRVVSVQRGYDPRDFVLVAFGGNGAIHAGVQAQELGIHKFIVPRTATAFSACGLLNSNIVINKMRTYIADSEDHDLREMNSLLSSMRRDSEADLPAVGRTDASVMSQAVYNYQIDMHYKGETHEITVPLSASNGTVTEEDIDQAVLAFHSAHETLHTFSNPSDPVHFMNLRLMVVIQTNKAPVQRLTFSGEDPAAALRTRRKVHFDQDGGFIETPIYDGSLVACGNIMQGPCIIEEPATTIVIYPGQAARLTELANYEITIGS